MIMLMTRNSKKNFTARLLAACGCLAIAGMSLGLTPDRAMATDWTVKGNLTSSVEYDDNIYLSNTNKTSGTRYSTSPKVTLSGENERNKFSLTGNGRIERFSGAANRDINEYGVSLNENYAASERLTLGANASVQRQSLLRAELQDTGIISLRGHVRNISGGANIGYKLSRTDQISLSGSYSNRHYTSATLVDYSEYHTSAAWQKQLSERVSLTTTVSGGIEKPSGQIQPTSKYGEGTIGVGYAFSDITSVNVFGGANYIHQSGPAGGTVGFSAGANANLQYEFTTLSASVSRSVSPSGIGQLVRSTTASVNFSRQLSQHFYFDASADVRFSKSQTNIFFALDRKYYDGNASIRWEFARHFGLSAYYGYSRQQIIGNSAWANDNRFGLRLVMDTEPRK
ncbi:MAG TPA: outer membrane beta-barrel protein [Alphaproteobacteria bacterium]|nr:outer membrane beta-barrel protein [Alphaproteobacteria bacterium]